MKDFSSYKYCPTLAVRPSEIKGLEFLPDETKGRLLPCFLLAPWANSKTLERTVERIEQAFKNRHYLLDIDHDYTISNSESPPQEKLISLKNSSGNYQNWIEFISQSNCIVPCVQVKNQNFSEIRLQLEEFRKLDRRFCLRIERLRFPSNLDEIVEAVSESGTADFIILLEGGWARDPLTLTAWFDGVLNGDLQKIDADVPAIISSTSMPKNFSQFEGISKVPIKSRDLFEDIQRKKNRPIFIYGDWGSTRPRDPPQIYSLPLPRIDYPQNKFWYIVRNKNRNWTYEDLAIEIINQTDVWKGDLGVWGEEMIQSTSITEKIGINTPQKNVAARVNLHLHLQAWFNQEHELIDKEFEDEWVD
ncbi:MAG: beta family protein [Paracoccaceae bacterium]|nr:beta family protein [Paracoccaceae bacterium]